MSVWSAILLAAVICLALKASGYLVPPSVLEAPRPARISDLLTVALLAALVAVQTLGAGQAVVVDARVPLCSSRPVSCGCVSRSWSWCSPLRSSPQS